MHHINSLFFTLLKRRRRRDWREQTSCLWLIARTLYCWTLSPGTRRYSWWTLTRSLPSTVPTCYCTGAGWRGPVSSRLSQSSGEEVLFFTILSNFLIRVLRVLRVLDIKSNNQWKSFWVETRLFSDWEHFGRNVFQCDSETDSLLVSRQERVQCQQAKYRAVHLSYLSLQQLEPLLQNFRYCKPGQQEWKIFNVSLDLHWRW